MIATGVASVFGLLQAEEQQRFEPAEISIGEPLELPKRAATQPLTAGGSGWLGLTADDSLVPGRLVVVEVAQPGPAARAGIRPQDQVLAINGRPLRSSDQLAAELAAITPGSDVKMAVGRGDRIDEVVVTAAERPTRTTLPPPATAIGSLPAEPAAAAPGSPWAAAPQQQSAPEQALPSEVMAGDFGPANLPARASAAEVPSYVPPAAAAPSYVPQAPATPAFEPAALAPAEPLRTAGPLPEPLPSPQAIAKGRTALGVRTLPVDPGVQARFGLPEPAGALVIGVVHDLPASRAGVPPGSVIIALDDRPVRSPSELTQVVTSSPADRPMTLQYIMPGGEKRRAEVSLQSLELPLEKALIGPQR